MLVGAATAALDAPGVAHHALHPVQSLRHTIGRRIKPGMTVALVEFGSLGQRLPEPQHQPPASLMRSGVPHAASATCARPQPFGRVSSSSALPSSQVSTPAQLLAGRRHAVADAGVRVVGAAVVADLVAVLTQISAAAQGADAGREVHTLVRASRESALPSSHLAAVDDPAAADHRAVVSAAVVFLIVAAIAPRPPHRHLVAATARVQPLRSAGVAAVTVVASLKN